MGESYGRGGGVEFPYYTGVKVHRSICSQLVKFIDRISQIFTAIESVRPRSKSGIPALCLLQVSIDKAKSLVQHCSDSSKLYLAITGEKILSRSEKIRGALESSLGQIQDMVPLLLAAKISGIADDIRDSQFHLDYSDKEAGRIVMSLIRRDITATSTTNDRELEALQIAACKLNITSPVAALIERRCIKRLIGKINDGSPRNKKILKYLNYLLKKYGKLIISQKDEDESSGGFFAGDCFGSSPEPPEEFKCPMSMRLMFDPSIIASGKTFERVWIERWLDEGNDTCPATRAKLDHLSVTPNSAMKSLIDKWCSKHGIAVPRPCSESLPASLTRSKTSCSSSVASFSGNIDNLKLEVSNVSICSSSNGSDLSGFHPPTEDTDEIKNSRGGSEDSQDSTLASLSSLADRSWESQCKVVRDLKNQLEGSDHQAGLWVTTHNFVNPLIKFMKDASEMFDVEALRDGAEVLLAILSDNRNEIPRFQGEAIYLLTSFIGSDNTGVVLAILEILSYEQSCVSTMMLAPGVLPSILRVLEDPAGDRSHTAAAMKILCNLSINNDIGCHMLYLDYVPTLVRFLGDASLAGHSIEIVKNLCSIEEARIAVSKSPECVAAMGGLLERGVDEQEHVLDVLLSLCHGGPEYRRLVMTESVVESLARASKSGNPRAKLMAMELLQLVGHERYGGGGGASLHNALVDVDRPCNSRTKKSYSKAFWSLSRDVSRFAKSR